MPINHPDDISANGPQAEVGSKEEGGLLVDGEHILQGLNAVFEKDPLIDELG